MEQVKNAAKTALEKLFNPAIDTTDPSNPAIVPLSAEEMDALKLLVSIRGLLPALDAGDCAALQEVVGEAEVRAALVNLAHLAVDRLFMTVYGV